MMSRRGARLMIACAILAACISACGVPVQDQPERLPDDLLGTALAPAQGSGGR